MRTTGAARTFNQAQVPRKVLYQVLDDARFAPSGGNKQGWHVVVVEDPALRRRLAQLSTLSLHQYVTEELAGFRGFSAVAPAPSGLEIRGDPPNYPIFEQIEDVPVVLVVTTDLRELAVLDRDLARPSIVGGASVYPFVQNILLAARNQGLGGVLTTFLVAHEPDVAELLDLPPEHAIAAMVMLGVPGKQATKLNRKSVELFTTVDRFSGESFTKTQA